MKRKVLFIGDKDFLKKYTDESIYKKYDITGYGRTFRRG